MLQRRLVASAWILILGFAGSAFGQGSPLPSEAALGRLGLTTAWWAFATIDSTRDRVKYLISDEQVTVVESQTGTVTEFDNATGRRRWAVQVGAHTDTRYPPTTTEQAVLVVSGRKVFALDKQTGDALWDVSVESAPSTSAGTDDEHAFVGSIDGSVFAFDLKFLSQLSKDVTLRNYMYRSVAWTFRTGGRVPYAPVSNGKIVCVPSEDGSLYGLQTEDHHRQFQFETDQPLGAPIGQLGDHIVVATKDLKVYSLNAKTGALKWEVLTGYHVHQQPRIIDQHVFICTDGAGMRCLSTEDGHEVWTCREATRFLAATPAVVYASTYVDDVLLINRANGRRIGEFSLRGFPVRVANDRTDRLYVASDKGLVLCLRERDRDYPLFHRQPEKRPVEPEIAPDNTGTTKPGTKSPKKGAEAAESTEKSNADAAPATTPAKPTANKPGRAKKGAKPKPKKLPTDSE